MLTEMQVLIVSAISIAGLHTLAGPDHYLPFITLSKARGWSAAKTIQWTILCGSGHILSSVLLGLGGAALGWSLSRFSWVENIRGGIAGWAMILFGLIYGGWGILQAYRNQAHKHFYVSDEELYVYEHDHGGLISPKDSYKVTPWVMFIIFILGPCEPMIPLLYFPAAHNNIGVMGLLILVYTLVTLITMLTMVLLGYYGLGIIKMSWVERYMHAIGGATILLCGLGMIFLAW